MVYKVLNDVAESLFSIIYRKRKQKNKHTHTHTHTHIQECVCRTKSGEKKEEEINSNFAVFVICHFGEIPPFILSFLR
jgi:hypothetical protein